LRPTGQPGQLPPTPAGGVAGTGEISEEEFYADAMDWEVELAGLQARAAQNADRLRAIADATENAEIKNQTENRISLMNKFGQVAAEVSQISQGAPQFFAQGIMELYNVAKSRSYGEWGAGAATAVLAAFPQLMPGVEAIVLGGGVGAALTLGAVAIADSLLRLGGFRSITYDPPPPPRRPGRSPSPSGRCSSSGTLSAG
jgi:hypothetical protein